MKNPQEGGWKTYLGSPMKEIAKSTKDRWMKATGARAVIDKSSELLRQAL